MPRDLREFVLTVMHQSATSDGVALLCAHRAAKAQDIDALMTIDRATFERKLNEETRLMTVRMGRKLAELADAIMAGRSQSRMAGPDQAGGNPRHASGQPGDRARGPRR